jgi:ribosomal-protein-alanine N-acetyltransferase
VRPGLTPLALEQAGREDLDALLDLQRACQTHPWTPRHFADALAGPARVLVLRRPWEPWEIRRGIVASCVIQVAAGEAQVHDLGVEPAQRRRGLGRWLLERGLRAAARAGARTAHLEVRASNTAALALYTAAGFRPAGRRRGYYAVPEEDAVLLARDLAEVP